MYQHNNNDTNKSIRLNMTLESNTDPTLNSKLNEYTSLANPLLPQEQNINQTYSANVHSIIELGSIEEFGDIVKKLVVNSQKRVLLICDIDGTLISPCVTIGTDPWFINSLNDDNINNVRKKLGLIYSLLEFKGVERKMTDEFVDLIQ